MTDYYARRIQDEIAKAASKKIMNDLVEDIQSNERSWHVDVVKHIRKRKRFGKGNIHENLMPKEKKRKVNEENQEDKEEKKQSHKEEPIHVVPLQTVRPEDYESNEPQIGALEDISDLEDDEEGDELKEKKDELDSPQIHLTEVHIENIKARLEEF